MRSSAARRSKHMTSAASTLVTKSHLQNGALSHYLVYSHLHSHKHTHTHLHTYSTYTHRLEYVWKHTLKRHIHVQLETNKGNHSYTVLNMYIRVCLCVCTCVRGVYWKTRLVMPVLLWWLINPVNHTEIWFRNRLHPPDCCFHQQTLTHIHMHTVHTPTQTH